MALHGAQAPARPGPLAAPTGRSPASHGIRIEASARIRLARMLCGLAVFLLPACIIATPWGLAPVVALIVPALLLAPDLVRAALRPSRPLFVPFLCLTPSVSGGALGSTL